MKYIELTKGEVALVDDEDYDKLNAVSWYCKILEKKSGKILKYANRKPTSGLIAMHRVILDAPKDLQVDHINGNGLDNRKANLRLCTQTENNHNLSIGRRNKSGFKGVSWGKQASKWRSNIVVDKKQLHLGFFDNKLDAAKAYNRAAVSYFGEFAKPNII